MAEEQPVAALRPGRLTVVEKGAEWCDLPVPGPAKMMGTLEILRQTEGVGFLDVNLHHVAGL